VGFEISASKYGNYPEQRIDRVWFDVESRLPVRIEKHGKPITDRPDQTLTSIEDQFEYYVQVPADMFTPEIPEDFVNTHPDNIRLAREKEQKGEMIYAQVSPGLKEEIVAALDKVKTVAYRENSKQIFLSRYAWREDIYNNDGQLTITRWYTIKKQDMEKTSLDFNDKGFHLEQVVVDFGNETYKVVTHDRNSRPRHPMDCILFQAGLIDRADLMLENVEIEGMECFGFEVSAKKYGTNPDGMLHRMWFDMETKLPVQMEFESPRDDGDKSVSVKDQFEWDHQLPADIFIPQIPEGFEPINSQSE
jgi:outer membrane lipoprotein-sorting protein